MSSIPPRNSRSETVPRHIDPARIGRWNRSTRRASWPLRRLWLDIETEGLANVPTSGPVVLAANHLSFLDSLVLMYETPRRVTMLGKAEYLDSPVTGRLFPAAGMIPVDRTGRGVAWSLRQALDRLADGEAIGVFPEGTRSRNGALAEGHPGVAHLALRSGAPIIPVGIIGSDRAQPVDARLPRFGAPITARFGAPLDLGRWGGAQPPTITTRPTTASPPRATAALSDQRVDTKPKKPTQ
ncbi:MAG: lysophospholipid acyltransferase family protein, partial [Acidimicrobiales bacterium]